MPTHSIEAAKQWRDQRVRPYTKPAPRLAPVPPPSTAELAGLPGAAEAVLFDSACIFAARFDTGRYGPLLIHLACVMSDQGHEASRRNGEMPASVADQWWALDEAYTEMFRQPGASGAETR